MIEKKDKESVRSGRALLLTLATIGDDRLQFRVGVSSRGINCALDCIVADVTGVVQSEVA